MGISKEMKCYYAGFLDGEGCVYITNKSATSKTNPLQLEALVSIAQNTREVLERGKKIWGGSIYLEPKSSVYRWVLQGKMCERFCRDVINYSFVKKEHLKLVLEFRKTKIYAGRLIPENIYDLRFKLKKQLSNLNSNMGFGIKPVYTGRR